MVRPTLYLKLVSSNQSPVDCAAEEYYKNDYPDEESSDYDLSGSDDGTYPYVSCHSLSLWKQFSELIDIFREDPNWYDNRDWR